MRVVWRDCTSDRPRHSFYARSQLCVARLFGFPVGQYGSTLPPLEPAFIPRVDKLLRSILDPAVATGTTELPLRAELFSIAQLEEHAGVLGASHELDPTTEGRGNDLLERLTSNEKTLRDAYRLLAEAVARGRRLTPAAEWFIDNYHLIEQQIGTARRHLPRGYNRDLPCLVGPRGSGRPRVYDLAHELISHSHGRVDLDRLRAFVVAYQHLQPLQIGELWALPIMLRLALIENLRRVAASITAGRRDRELALGWADRLIEVATTAPGDVVLVLAELVAAKVALTDAFVTELASRLQGQGAALSFPTSWIEQRLAEHGQSVEQVFARVSQDQAAAQVAVSNSIGSLRVLGAIDWRDFVETVSLMERELLRDPAGVYATMEFASRDRYRHVVEEVSRQSGRSESYIASLAVGLAVDGDARRGHVGWFLVDEGRPALDRAASAHGRVRAWVARVVKQARLGLYLGSIAAVTTMVTWWSLVNLPDLGLTGVARVGFIALLAMCSSQLAIALVHWAVTSWVPPKLLPRLDFSAGIPAAHHTLVAVPILLTSEEEIDEHLELLEVRFLANRDANLHFALISDFRDATTKCVDGDDALVGRAESGIAALNDKYGPSFLLFHRARCHNVRERVWMGWERKRGKLEELNAALRGDSRGFSSIVGPLDRVQDVRYVIALDADTQLPRDAARTLAATSAHPLNRPVYDPRLGRVTAGYSILQPRVSVTMESAGQSRFAALFGGEPGIDPYSRAVSDVYQDLFGEGSFVGKGIYDVDAIRTALGGRLPANRVLSHDLLEGAYGRAGLVSDVTLFEHYPYAHSADVSRRHRWMRGDWQLTPWLGWRVPAGEGAASACDPPNAGKPARVANPITLLSRWKLLDNLRRTLVPFAALGLLLLGWTLPAAALFVTLFVVAIAVVPGLLAVASGLARRSGELTWRRHLAVIGRDFGRQLTREFIALASLPHDAWLGIDAIARTVVRVLVTRRKLIEWRTASDAQRNARNDILGSYVAGWIAPIVALVTPLALLVPGPVEPRVLWLAAPMLVAWLAAPALTWWLSQPISQARPRLAHDQLIFLGALARRTWRFFETYVAAEDHFLPPDNFQEDPPRGIAHRTSPTNIGLSLTASLAAYDFGYIDTRALVERTRRTFATMQRLERYRGHFFNWYDTLSLAPLAPQYVSTVDSGNLTGHLLTLASGLEQLAGEPVVQTTLFAGLVETLDAFASVADPQARGLAARQEPARPRMHGDAVLPLVAELQGALRRTAADPPRTLTAVRGVLLGLEAPAAQLVDAATATGDTELQWWSTAFADQRSNALAALEYSAPWAALLAGHAAELGEHLAHLDGIPTSHALAKIEFAAELGPGAVREAVLLGSQRARQCTGELAELAALARDLGEVEYDFLYDRDCHLLSIGYNVGDHRLDAGFYDLLASEARLASFIAIAYGKLPQEHWFSLGRVVTSFGGRPALLSWSGSMFEYLMPLLLMPTYEGTLLDATYRVVVAHQIDYGRDLAVPWGVSESGYNKTDTQLNYQYQAFGVPGLGFKRGLGDDVVIAPYATAMALMVDPRAACSNLLRLANALLQLPEDQREVVTLKHLKNMPLQQIAEHLNRTTASVAGLLRRGLAQLRSILDEPP